MDVGKLHSSDEKKKDEEVVLPGFRFHPTDEELVGFYLKRKVEKKPLRIELIKQLDIYKYDPWDLPKVGMSASTGDKEWYFFCIRGRKYKNSIRPNRVTRSGFWKATGIDKPIYRDCVQEKEKEAHQEESHECIIGLKKSLVYYMGSAGKGTKTDWMMHEFRLPQTNATNDVQQAEVWTLCRIFKRIPSYKKYTPDLKDSATLTKPINPTHSSSSKSCSLDSENGKPHLITFRDSPVINQNEKKPVIIGQAQISSSTMSNPIFLNQNVDDEAVFANRNWEDLRSVVQFSNYPSTVYDCTETYLPPYFS